jgi:hypothetical protein
MFRNEADILAGFPEMASKDLKALLRSVLESGTKRRAA